MPRHTKVRFSVGGVSKGSGIQRKSRGSTRIYIEVLTWMEGIEAHSDGMVSLKPAQSFSRIALPPPVLPENTPIRFVSTITRTIVTWTEKR